MTAKSLAEVRGEAEEALAGVERERLVSHIREAAKFATRADRMVFLHDYEAKALVVVIDALRALLAALPGEGAEGPLPEYGPCPYYRNGEPHSNCEVCGRLGALPILPVDILAPQSPEVEAAAGEVVRGDWWGHFCPSCGSAATHGPECVIGRLLSALDARKPDETEEGMEKVNP